MSYYGTHVTVVAAPMIMRFTPNEEPAREVPLELRGFYAPEIWHARITAVTQRASRYYKYGLEWVWMIVSFVSLIAVPIAVYYLVLHHLPEDKDDDDDKDDDHHPFDRYWKARLISLAVWVAVMLLVFVPMHMWKSSGKKAVNKMLAEYEAQDKAARPGQPVPSFRMKMPHIISKHIKLVAVIPPNPSYYQPGAIVPGYLVNEPVDMHAQQMQYAAQKRYQNGPWGSGAHSQNASGELPLYNNDERRLPGYDGSVNFSEESLSKEDERHGYSMEDMKNPFDDMKV